MMNLKSDMTPEQLFFSVFCIESISDELGMPGADIYIAYRRE